VAVRKDKKSSGREQPDLADAVGLGGELLDSEEPMHVSPDDDDPGRVVADVIAIWRPQSSSNSERLAECEAKVESGRRNNFETADAIYITKTEKLYLEKAQDWEKYVAQEFPWMGREKSYEYFNVGRLRSEVEAAKSLFYSTVAVFGAMKAEDAQEIIELAAEDTLRLKDVAELVSDKREELRPEDPFGNLPFGKLLDEADELPENVVADAIRDDWKKLTELSEQISHELAELITLASQIGSRSLTQTNRRALERYIDEIVTQKLNIRDALRKARKTKVNEAA
jgi:hypothetical protein